MNIKNLIPWARKNEVQEFPRKYSDPFYELHRDMNRVFENFFQDFAQIKGFKDSFNYSGFSPKVNISETVKEINVEVELAGLDEKGVEVSIQEKTLVLKGEKKNYKEYKKENYHVLESSFGYFNRSIVLPLGIDKEKIEAKFKNGLMKIKIPKLEASKSNIKRITFQKD